MIRRIVTLLLCCAPIMAHAATMITLNGTSSPITTLPGTIVTAAVTGGPGNPGDWLGVYAIGAPSGPGDPASWKWLSTDDARGSVPPGPGVTAGTVHLVIPTVPGIYQVRFFPNNGFNVTATSATITVPGGSQSTKEITWVAGQSLASIPVGWFPQGATIVSMNCRIEKPVGAPATFWLVKAPAGVSLASAARISPNTCDANAPSPTNQALLFTGSVTVNPGDTVGIATASQTWATGHGMGIVSVGYTVP